MFQWEIFVNNNPKSMTVTWLGQAGLLFDIEDYGGIMLDPYLSNSLEESEEGSVYRRQVEIDATVFSLNINALILTHIHQDHTDPATLDHFLQKQRTTVLAPLPVITALRGRYTLRHRFVMLCPGIEYSLEKDILIKAIPAFHSDRDAVGVLIQHRDLCIYITGDTLYNSEIVKSIPCPVDYMFVVINGEGNNMNFLDAARLTNKIAPRNVVPVHWDMFAGYSSDPGDFLNLFVGNSINAFQLTHYQAYKLKRAFS
jgi:L-ascorbate metabolism protein UlaG (beta-lactamase superfamily)